MDFVLAFHDMKDEAIVKVTSADLAERIAGATSFTLTYAAAEFKLLDLTCSRGSQNLGVSHCLKHGRPQLLYSNL